MCSHGKAATEPPLETVAIHKLELQQKKHGPES